MDDSTNDAESDVRPNDPPGPASDIGDPGRQPTATAAGVAGLIAALSLAFFLVGWTRPLDLAISSSRVEVCIAGLVGFGAVVAMGMLMKGSDIVRPLAFLLGGIGLFVMTGATLLTLAFGGGPTSETTVAVPETDLTMAVVSGNSALAEDEVVLIGNIGPFPRRRVVASLSHSCTASIRAIGPRMIEATMEEMTEACGTVGRGGTYVIEVGSNGWTTTIERVPEE